MKRVETVSPGAGVVSARRGTWASWTTRARRAASSRASLTFGSMVSRARRRTSPGTRVCARSTPSNRLVYSRTAAPPRTRTSSVIGFTRSTARSTSRAARGSTPSSTCLVSPSAARPRRSITVVTGLTPLSEVTCPVYEGRRPVAEPSACWTAACLACLSRRLSVVNGGGIIGAGVGGAAGAPFGDQDDDRGDQRPERQRALGAKGERCGEQRAGRAAAQVLVVAGQADLLAQPEHDERAGDAAEDQAGRRGRPDALGGAGTGPRGQQEPVAEQPGDQPCGGADQAEPAVGDDERARLDVHELSRSRRDLLEQRAGRDLAPDEPGEQAEQGAACERHREPGDGGPRPGLPRAWTWRARLCRSHPHSRHPTSLPRRSYRGGGAGRPPDVIGRFCRPAGIRGVWTGICGAVAGSVTPSSWRSPW